MGGTMGESTSILEAPDFTLADVNGRDVRLADFAGQKHVILVFNRGFA
jgi:peroxiredoxin